MALEKIPENERGPLYGLPISVKECFYVKDHDSTIGISRFNVKALLGRMLPKKILFRFVNKPLKEDGAMVKAMREQGGIPFCLTNVPQTMKVLSYFT